MVISPPEWVNLYVYKVKLRYTRTRRVQNQSEEAKRACLSPDFPFEEGNQKNLGITTIGRWYCNRSDTV
ncbi:hypothetical protein PAEAM_32470 [Paenibacillus sp. GM1FR]|nr:hypothetical protein PAEAM_32470 [Paenibacillus sp. GM1FR]